MRRAFWIVIALYAALLARVIAAGSWSALHLFWTSDDAFFYLTIARHIAQGAGSTFDGLHPTNGYQPLWLIVMAAVYRMTGSLSPEAGVRVAMAAAGIAAVVGTTIVVRLIQRLSAPPIVAVASALGLLSSFGFWYFGLEAHLNVVTAGVVFSLVWRQWDGVVDRRQRTPAVAALGLAVSCALLVLTRVDLVVWVVVLLLALSWARARGGWRPSAVLRAAMIEQGVSAAFVLSYLAVNRRVFGAWLPISAMLRTKTAGVTWRALAFHHWVDTAQGAVLVGAALVMIAVAAGAVALRGRAAVVGARLGFGAVLAIGVLAHTAVTVLYSVSIEPRYLVTSSCAVVVIVAILLTHVMATGPRRRRGLLSAAVAIGVVVVAGALARIAMHRIGTAEDAPADLADLAQFRHDIAPFATRDAVVFAVDFSGELAWFCDCHLVNGDGLVNDWSFQRYVADRRVKDYLDAARVTYVIETSGESHEGMMWVSGWDWKAVGAESFPIVGYAPASALVTVGQFRLFRYPDGAIAPASGASRLLR
jgi:hypothetical protein